MNENNIIVAMLKSSIIVKKAEIKAHSDYVLNINFQLKCMVLRKEVELLEVEVSKLKNKK